MRGSCACLGLTTTTWRALGTEERRVCAAFRWCLQEHWESVGRTGPSRVQPMLLHLHRGFRVKRNILKHFFTSTTSRGAQPARVWRYTCG